MFEPSFYNIASMMRANDPVTRASSILVSPELATLASCVPLLAAATFELAWTGVVVAVLE